MALDTRDYWKKKWNKRTGYVEKANFRVGQVEAQNIRRERILADVERRRAESRSQWGIFFRTCVCLASLGYMCYGLAKWLVRAYS